MPADAPSGTACEALTIELMTIPGLCGYEGRVRRRLAAEMRALGTRDDDRPPRQPDFDHAGRSGQAERHAVRAMDQLGFVVRKIEANGLIRLERLGGVPERALAAQEVLICVGEGRDVPALIANKSHHATTRTRNIVSSHTRRSSSTLGFRVPPKRLRRASTSARLSSTRRR